MECIWRVVVIKHHDSVYKCLLKYLPVISPLFLGSDLLWTCLVTDFFFFKSCFPAVESVRERHISDNVGVSERYLVRVRAPADVWGEGLRDLCVDEPIPGWFVEPSQFIFSLLADPTGSSSFSLSFNHSQRSEWTHSSLEFNALSHCWLCSLAVSPYLSGWNNRITEHGEEETADSAVIAMATWAGSESCRNDIALWASAQEIGVQTGETHTCRKYECDLGDGKSAGFIIKNDPFVDKLLWQPLWVTSGDCCAFRWCSDWTPEWEIWRAELPPSAHSL